MSQVAPENEARDSRTTRLHACAWGLLLVGLAIIPFLPALNGQFTWDDDQWLVDNAAVHAWNGLSVIWNPHLQSLHFYPVTFTVLWLGHKLWELNPIGYHLVNMVTHAGGTVFLWRVLRRLGLRHAWLAALIWAVHPIQAESVAWVSEVKNTLSGLFYFLAMWSYCRFERLGEEPSAAPLPVSPRRNWPFYVISFIAFIAALLAKTVVCTLPAALVLLLWWKRKKLSARLLLPTVPFFLAGLFLAAWSAGQEKADLLVGGGNNLVFSPLERCIIAGKDICFYLRTIFVPYPLMPVYPRWTFATSDPLNYLPLLAAILIIAAAWALRRRIGYWPLVGLLFFLGSLAPALGFINFFTMHYTFVADHYQYIACAGIIVPVVEALGRRMLKASSSLSGASNTPRVAASFLLCAGIMTLTAFYASLFRTNMALWTWNVARNPAAFTAQHNLAVAYFVSGDIADGDAHLDTALAQAPDDDNVQRTVGKRSLAHGDYADALAHFQKALELRPRFGMTSMLLGDTYLHMGQLQKALDAYRTAITVDGGDFRYYVAYAAALRKNNQLPEAAAQYELALRISPGNMITRYNYANLLLDMNKPKQAIEQYQLILKYQDNSPLVWHNLAAAYYMDGQMDQAQAAKKHANELEARIAPATPSATAAKP